MHFEVRNLATVGGIELVLRQVDEVGPREVVVERIEGDGLLAVGELDIPDGLSLLSRVSKIDEVPFGDVVLVLDRLVDIGIALAIEVFISV